MVEGLSGKSVEPDGSSDVFVVSVVFAVLVEVELRLLSDVVVDSVTVDKSVAAVNSVVVVEFGSLGKIEEASLGRADEVGSSGESVEYGMMVTSAELSEVWEDMCEMGRRVVCVVLTVRVKLTVSL